MAELVKFSVSDASQFKLCPRSFYYKKILGWEQAIPSKHLDLGMQYDRLLQTLDEKGYNLAFEEIPRIFTDEHDAAEAELLLSRYSEKFMDDPLPPTHKGNQHGFGVDLDICRLTGYIDKLATKTISGNQHYVVVERKTTTEAIEDNSAYWNRLDLDPQIRSYVLYLQKRGLPCGWVCYEVLRKINSSYHPKFAKKKEIPIDQYRSLLQTHSYRKTLVNRKWFYVDHDMTQEFENEHKTVFAIFQNLLDTTNAAKEQGLEDETLRTFWPKCERSCDAYGGCQYLPICKKQVSFETGPFTHSEGKYK